MTPTEAYGIWASDSETVKVLDVRAPEEYAFVGQPETAMSIPFVMHTYRWEPELGRHDPDHVPFGGKAAMAVGALAQAGYPKVLNILEGMEGDRVNDPRSVYHRKRMVNGWKNAGLPWTYDLNPDQMRLPVRP